MCVIIADAPHICWQIRCVKSQNTPTSKIYLFTFYSYLTDRARWITFPNLLSRSLAHFHVVVQFIFNSRVSNTDVVINHQMKLLKSKESWRKKNGERKREHEIINAMQGSDLAAHFVQRTMFLFVCVFSLLFERANKSNNKPFAAFNKTTKNNVDF